MKSLLLLALIAMSGCVRQADYDAKIRYIEARLSAESDADRRLDEQLTQHLCEFHKPEYACLTADEVRVLLEE